MSTIVGVGLRLIVATSWCAKGRPVPTRVRAYGTREPDVLTSHCLLWIEDQTCYEFISDMSKRHRRRNPTKRKRVSPDEVYQYGPLRLERMGRYVGLSSDWAPVEFEKHIARVKANKEPFRNEINS